MDIIRIDLCEKSLSDPNASLQSLSAIILQGPNIQIKKAALKKLLEHSLSNIHIHIYVSSIIDESEDRSILNATWKYLKKSTESAHCLSFVARHCKIKQIRDDAWSMVWNDNIPSDCLNAIVCHSRYEPERVYEAFEKWRSRGISQSDLFAIAKYCLNESVCDIAWSLIDLSTMATQGMLTLASFSNSPSIVKKAWELVRSRKLSATDLTNIYQNSAADEDVRNEVRVAFGKLPKH